MRTPALATLSLLVLAACSDSNPAPPLAVTAVSGQVNAIGGGALDQYVTLTFTPAGGGAPVVVTANANGAFNQPLAAGTYSVLVERPGYEDFSQGSFTVTGGRNNPLSVALMPLPANTYIGSADCGVCHTDLYATFRQTGHPFKLNKVIGGVPPTYPFTDIGSVVSRIDDDDTTMGDPHPGTDNTLGTPAGWSDISYVIGGFGWKARFIDNSGYIITGSEVQYNFATDQMVAYHDNEVDKKFNCGNCHTTGWKHNDPVVNPFNQDGLPGMDGTFAEQGIGCEACHGAGSTHAQTSLPTDITLEAIPRTTQDFMDGSFAYGKPIACGECHTRDGERDWPTFRSAFDEARIQASMPVMREGGRINAKGGLIRHHEQYDEALGIDPDTLETTRSVAFLFTHGRCVVCHDPHKAVVHRDDPAVTEPGVDASNAACLRCHPPSQYDPRNNRRGSMTSLQCIDCHMPKMAKSATSRTQPNGVLEGDVASHIFRINVSGAPQFTPNGSFAYPYITAEWACNNCHGDEVFALFNGVPPGFDYHPDN